MTIGKPDSKNVFIFYFFFFEIYIFSKENCLCDFINKTFITICCLVFNFLLFISEQNSSFIINIDIL